MPLAIAHQAIERHFRDSDGFQELEISLHGGEPFIEFDRLRNLAEWIWEQSWPKPFIVFATTNGTLVHGPAQEWAAANKSRFYLALSVDGTSAMHNANRSNSFDRIDTEFFLRTWPDQPVKMTVSDLTLPSLAEGVIYLQERGFKVQCNFAYGVDWADSHNLTVLTGQLEKLIAYYLGNPAVEPCDFMSMEMAAVGAASPEGILLSGSGERGPRKWCGIGTDLFAIDVDGTEYPCHLFLPLAAGEKSDWHKRFDFSDAASLQDERCRDCTLLPVCPTCYGMNSLETGNPAIRNKALCSLTKLRALAVSKMAAKMILRRSEFSVFREMSEDNLSLAIMGIEGVQSSIRL